MGNDPIDMRPIKDKLSRLEEFLPDPASPITYDFAHFLADYIFNSLRPQEFVEEYRMAIGDLIVGKNGFTGKPIRGKIANHSRVVYDTLTHELGKIADAIMPKEFAEAMRTYMTENELTPA